MALPSFCFSLNLYISATGNDRNNGSLKKSLASLQGAINRIRVLNTAGQRENITVNIGPGIYYLNEPVRFENRDGGSKNFTVTYKGSGVQKPVFSGGKMFTGFKRDSDGLWSIYLPEVKAGTWYFEDFYINGVRATRARWPNEGYFHPASVAENVLKKSAGPVAEKAVQTITISTAQQQLLNSIPDNQLQSVVLSFYHKWDNTKKKIQSYNQATGQVTVVGLGMIPWNVLDKKSLFTIENTKAALDAPGEWYLDRQTGFLYYYPHSSDNIATAKCCVPVVDKFIFIEGQPKSKVQNLRFENLTFSYSGFIAPDAGIDPVQAAATVDATIMVDFAEGVTFNNCDITHTGIYGIWFRKNCIGCTVSNSSLWDVGAGGVKLGEINHDPAVENSSALTVDNNIIQHGGQVYPCGVGILLFTAAGCHITHNDVSDFKYSGISAGWVWGTGDSYSKNNEIAYNHIHHLGWGVLSDMGGIYTLGKSEGTVINNNCIHDVYAHDYGGWGIYNDEGSTEIMVTNNLVYNCKSAAYHDHFGNRNTVKNNLFYNQMGVQLESNSDVTPGHNRFTNNVVVFERGSLTNNGWNKNRFFSDSNAYWDSRQMRLMFGEKTFEQWQAAGQDIHSVIVDPLFVNPTSLDFTIGNKQLLNRIGFKPFDYRLGGLYGSKSRQTAAANNIAIINFQKAAIQADK